MAMEKQVSKDFCLSFISENVSERFIDVHKQQICLLGRQKHRTVTSVRSATRPGAGIPDTYSGLHPPPCSPGRLYDSSTSS